MHLPINEQETTIQWNRDESFAIVYTSDLTMMTKYDKYVKEGDWTLKSTDTIDGDVVSKTYLAPKSLVYGRSKKKTMTEENKEKVRKALIDARAKKNVE